MTSIFKDINLKDCLDIHILKHNTKTVELFGEIHNKKLPKTNSYTKMIPLIKDTNALVLVEHSNIFCNLTHLDEATINFMLGTGGSETIFYNLKKDGFKKINCIDNRIVHGLMTVYQKKIYEKILNNMLIEKKVIINEDILNMIKSILSVFDNIKSTKMSKYFSKSIYNNVYTRFIEVFEIQIKFMFLFFKKNRENPKVFEEFILERTNNGILFINNILNILDNFEKLGSVIVDINILNILLGSLV